MKKFFALLSLLLVFSMVSCASSSLAPAQTATGEAPVETKTEAEDETKTQEVLAEGPHDPTGFATGFGKVVVNPNPGVGLGGYGNAGERTSTVVTDDICISCVAVTDGETTLLLYSLDAIYATATNWSQIARQVSNEFGIPKDCILLNASHSHSAPAINSGVGNMAQYMQSFYKGALQAAKIAVADLDRSELKYTRTETDGLSYIRRYIKQDTGEFVGNWPNTLDPALYAHESMPDEEMLIIYFDRVNQEDIVLCNWQCHVTNVGTETGGIVSSDYVGAFRDYVSEQLGVHCAFFQGAAGSTIPFGKLRGENSNGDYKKHGRDIGDVLIAALPTLQTMENTKIETAMTQFPMIVKPEKVADYGETDDMTVCAFAIGDIAIATSPSEMDHRSGKFVKENSPYTMTFMSAYSNGGHGYIPAETSFPNEGYEVNSCRYVAGSAEKMSNEIVALLNSLHQN